MSDDQKDSVWPDVVQYQQGFGQHFCTEALPDALPKVGNTPQQCPYGLYAEQLSGTAFTAPRVKNHRSWLYRIIPSCKHPPYQPYTPKSGKEAEICADFSNSSPNPNQMRWNPLPLPDDNEEIDFVDGLITIMGAGTAESKSGLAVHLYRANKSMTRRAFYSADGDFLIVPQLGTLRIRTELGLLEVASGEFCVIPRGIKFSVNVSEASRGYILEIFQGRFEIPDLGPIGANGLANPRDFEAPVAAFEDPETAPHYTVVQKFLGKFFSTELGRSPFDVVAWHGNFNPYKYDLSKFCVVNSVSYDHLDPSIFTVLTCQSNDPGVAVADFVVFPPRWMVQERTFRPPYYHRNCMSEYMGNIRGAYEAKPKGFMPGGGSLHNTMIGHGPDGATFDKASTASLTPVKSPDNALAFMFESSFMYRTTDFATTKNLLQPDYWECWEGVKSHFNREWKRTDDK